MANISLIKLILLVSLGIFVGLGIIAGIVLAIVFSVLHAKKKKRVSETVQTNQSVQNNNESKFQKIDNVNFK